MREFGQFGFAGIDDLRGLAEDAAAGDGCRGGPGIERTLRRLNCSARIIGV